ncbi:MAG: YfhO family protein [Anaerolineae bacterium]
MLIRRYRPDALIIGVLALLPLLFFWRLVTPNRADQMRLATGDFTAQYYPLRAFSAAGWAAGRVPLWTPALYGGQPALADIQSGALYPPHVIQALALGRLGRGFPLRALEWQVLLHFAVAGVGAFLLGRYWGRQAGAGLKSARFMGLVLSLTFVYGGYLTGFPVQQMTVLLVSAWLPWVMWLLSRTLDAAAAGQPLKVSLADAAWTGLALAMAILAGHPQTTMYIVYLSFAYGVWRAVRRAKQSDARAAGRLVAHWAAALGLGVLVSAAQVWPTLEFIARSLRAGLSFEAVSAGLPPAELVSVLYPGYFGGSPEYVGILPLALIAAAAAVTRPPVRQTVLFWLAVGAAAMVLALGANTFLYPLAYLLAPGFDAVRQQERVFLVYSFAAATLSGYGALALSRPLSPGARRAWARLVRRMQWLAGAALALTGLFVYGAVAANVRGEGVNLFVGVLRHHIFGLIILGGSLLLFALRPRRIWRRGWGMGLVAGWLAFNLFTVNWQFNLEARSPDAPFNPGEVGRFLQARAAARPFRIASGGRLAGGNNAASVYGLEDITGNTPLQLASVAAFAEQMPLWRYWQLMNVRYVVDERDLDGPGLTRRFEADGLKVFEVGDPFPRARLVYRAITGEDVSALAAGATNLKTTALLPPGVSLPLEGGAGPSAARVVQVWPGFMAVEVETGTNGLLVLSNVFYPGWRAALNGAPVEIYRVNGIFQGVFVPPGKHRVEVRFAPNSFRRGSVLSLAGLAAALGLVLAPKVKGSRGAG